MLRPELQTAGARVLGCWSCLFWREHGCAMRNEWFPKRCEEFTYEPGADEEERHE